MEKHLEYIATNMGMGRVRRGTPRGAGGAGGTPPREAPVTVSLKILVETDLNTPGCMECAWVGGPHHGGKREGRVTSHVMTIQGGERGDGGRQRCRRPIYVFSKLQQPHNKTFNTVILESSTLYRSPACSGVRPLPPLLQLEHGIAPTPWHTMHLKRSITLPFTLLCCWWDGKSKRIIHAREVERWGESWVVCTKAEHISNRTLGKEAGKGRLGLLQLSALSPGPCPCTRGTSPALCSCSTSKT